METHIMKTHHMKTHHMKTHRMKTILIRLSLVVLALGSPAAMAAWPDDRPIELVVGFAPGGGTDTMARILARFAEKRLSPNAKIVVVNKPGAGGELAAAYVAQAKPDGYTVGMVNVPGFIFLPMYRKTSYQPAQIRLIARLVDDPALMIAKQGGAAPQTLAAMVQALKKTPGAFSVGHPGEGTTGHLATLQLEKAAGVQINSVPYKGVADAKLALMGGHVDYVILTTGEALDVGQPGSKFVGVAQWSREGDAKGVQRTHDAGFEVQMSSERGIGGPRALPDDIVRRLQDVIAQTLKDPAFLDAAKSDAPVLAFLPGDEWERRLNQSRQALQELVPLMRAK
jgi:tripartite-type tricarboxylate transporter receptor subunit TctC